MVRLGWVRSPQSIEVRFGTSRAGAVDVALYTTASVDAVIPAHPEVDWEQLRTVEKGRRSPLAALAKQAPRPERATQRRPFGDPSAERERAAVRRRADLDVATGPERRRRHGQRTQRAARQRTGSGSRTVQTRSSEVAVRRAHGGATPARAAARSGGVRQTLAGRTTGGQVWPAANGPSVLPPCGGKAPVRSGTAGHGEWSRRTGPQPPARTTGGRREGGTARRARYDDPPRALLLLPGAERGRQPRPAVPLPR
jgi:hypothetical protein